MHNSKAYKFALSQPYPCNYLPDKQEQLLISIDEELQNNLGYSSLIAVGFRRSGNQVYRPQCQQCDACQSIRLPVNQFIPSKSQKRNIARNKDIVITVTDKPSESYYPLYQCYINSAHQDGPMYPASQEQYDKFIPSSKYQQRYIEFTLDNKLIAVAVCDLLNHGLSAVYTFYQPNLRKRGLGVFAILTQVKLTQQLSLDYLYLGYQIDQCQKMNYKTRYYPHERLIKNQWKLINK